MLKCHSIYEQYVLNIISFNNIELNVTTNYSRQDGGEWGEGAQLARCCRRVEFGAIAN